MTPSESETQRSNERKRKSEASKATKKRVKEEEKENVQKTKSVSPNSLPGSSRESSLIALPRARQRKSQKPVKNYAGSSMASESPATFVENTLETMSSRRPQLFRIGDIIRKQSMIENKAQHRSRQNSNISERCGAETRECIVFEVVSDKLLSWSEGLISPTGNEGLARVQLFGIYVNKNGTFEVVEEGVSLIPVGSDALQKPQFEKKIFCFNKVKSELKSTYVGVVVTRLVSGIGGKNGRCRRNSAVLASGEDVECRMVTRSGCCILYDKEKDIDYLGSNAVHHIVFQNREDNPKYSLDSTSLSSIKDWFKNEENLDIAKKNNGHKDNSRFPRLQIVTDESKRTQHSKARSLPAKTIRKITYEFRSGDVALPGRIFKTIEKDGVICPFRNLDFYTIDRLFLNMKANYPCFSYHKTHVDVNTATVSIFSDAEFFEETTVATNYCFYRRMANRKIPVLEKRQVNNAVIHGDRKKRDAPKKNAPKNNAPRNNVPGLGERKYGLDFIQTTAQLPVMDVVYKKRNTTNSLIPKVEAWQKKSAGSSKPVKEKTRRQEERERKDAEKFKNEHFPLNNAAMFCDVAIINQDNRILVNMTSDNLMQVVEKALTQEDIDVVNQRYSEVLAKVKKEKKAAPGSEPRGSGDIEENPIPNFAELFFPYGMNELYNILLRFFLSEAGIRPGELTAEWKSRIMNGFLLKNYRRLFENNLDNIYKKHIQLIALNTPGWLEEHITLPMQQLMHLKKQWRQEKDLHHVHIPFDGLIYESKNHPKFERPPKFVSEYCVKYNSEIQLGRMRAKKFHDKHMYSRPNSFSFDLNAGLETVDPKEGDEKLDVLLEWIRKISPEGGRLKKAVYEADIVCWRGLLTKLATTIYDKEAGWRVKAVKRRGVIFLLEEKTERREANETDMQKRMSYWGHKFEQYVTKDDDAEEPDTSSPLTTKEEYAVVCRNDILTDPRLHPERRSLRILYSGEVDCLDKYRNMIELKTQNGQLHAGFWKSSKSLKWWLQSSLVNVNSIIVGHWDRDGFVGSLSAVSMHEMPQRATWNFRACFDFTSTILTYVSNCLEEEGSACLVEYHSEQSLQKGIQMRRIPAEECDYVPESFLEKYY